jgi:hypothetical protein
VLALGTEPVPLWVGWVISIFGLLWLASGWRRQR